MLSESKKSKPKIIYYNFNAFCVYFILQYLYLSLAVLLTGNWSTSSLLNLDQLKAQSGLNLITLVQNTCSNREKF